MARTAIIEITRKPTAVQVRALRTGAADDKGIIEVSADKRTHEGLVGRGMADWVTTEKLFGRSGRSLSTYCVITQRGRDYLAKLDAQTARQHETAHDAQFLDADGQFRADRCERAYMSAKDNADQTAREEGYERGTEQWFRVVTSSYASLIDDGAFTEPAPAAQEATSAPQEAQEATAPALTRDDVAEAVETAMQWLPFSQREEARAAGAVAVLTAEFARARRVMRRAMKTAGPIAAQSALKQYDDVAAALKAAKHYAAQDEQAQQAAEEAAPLAPGTRISTPMGRATVTGYDAPSGLLLLERDGAEATITASSPYLRVVCIKCDTVGDDSLPHRETPEGHLCGYCAAMADDTTQEDTTVTEQQAQADPFTQPAGVAACGCTPEEITAKHERPASKGACSFTLRPGYNPWGAQFSRNSGTYRDPRPAVVICSAHDGDHEGSAECRYPYIPARLAASAGA